MSTAIEYLLNLLDEGERRAFEAMLSADSRLGEELARLAAAGARLKQDEPEVEPQPGLVERTRIRLLVSLRKRD
jgi:anti-sigma-K factor RskA